MKNLAGVKDCDMHIVKELIKAGISPVELEKSDHYEVKSLYEGNLLGWIFRRQWYYWSASCENVFEDGLDIRYASPLHLMIGQEVRLAGHCGCPSPDDGFWMAKFDNNGNELISSSELARCEKDAKTSELMAQTYERLVDKYKAVESPIDYARDYGRVLAGSYHIDTQIGLEMFCLTLRKQDEDRKLAKRIKEQSSVRM